MSMNKHKSRFFLVAIGVFALSGCMVGPNYERPVLEVPDVWQETSTAKVVEGEASLQTWWTVFEDPKLEDLIDRARASNLDVQQAVWRIQEARAIRGIAKGELLPSVRGTGDLSRDKASENVVPTEELAEPRNFFSVGLDSSWELDVFGRIRRSIEAATAELEASVEDYRDVLVTLLSDVALNYIELRALQARITYAEANVVAQQETLQITRDRFDAGLVSQLDITQAESNLANTEAQIPPLRAGLTGALNRLAVLLGVTPGSLNAELIDPSDIPVPPEEITVGLPAELLRQRPDVRRAERFLAAQTARIGIRTADLYPRFSLFGFLALESTDGGDLFKSSSGTWGFGLPIRWNIFQGGRIRAAIRVEEARTEQALLAYEQSVLRALEEVENAMVFYYQERLRRDKLVEAVEASRRSVDLVRTQYMAGLTNFQNVLDTQRSLFNQQDQLAASEGVLVQSLVALYKSLGGGWNPELLPTPESRLHVVSDQEPQ
jgi:NodT family efflux transporter outer membrane factor (OMF) lipoprotein